MAIDRTNFNALTDETGSGNGSIWDKATIQSVLLDPIDAALVTAGGVATYISSTATGTQNDWAPGLSGNTFIVWTGASDMTVTGIAGGTAGQVVAFKNDSATATRLATFNHASGSSSAANRFTNMATSAATSVAQGGYVIYQHNGTNWKMVGHTQGAWITPAYAAGDFTAGGSQTWTVDSGDVTVYRYALHGRKLIVNWVIVTTTVGGTPHVELRLKIPGGFTAAAQASSAHFYKDSGGAFTFGETWINQASTPTLITLYTVGFGSGNWTAATNTTHTYGQIHIEVT